MGALGSGLLQVGIDSIGLVPEGSVLSRTISRTIGHSFNYRGGAVADTFGHNTLRAVTFGLGIGTTGVNSTEKSDSGIIATGLGVGGIVSTAWRCARCRTSSLRSRDPQRPLWRWKGDRELQLGKVITAEDREMRLPWWGVLCVIAGGLPVMFLFDHFGRLISRAQPLRRNKVIIAIAVTGCGGA